MNINIKKTIKANYQQILFVFLAFLAMVLVSYFYVSSIVREQILIIGEETMNTTQATVSSSLSEAELSFVNAVNTVENMLAVGDKNEGILAYLKSLTDYFVSGRSSMPGFLKMYAYIGGEFLDGSGWIPPSDYRPATRTWYIGAEASDNKVYFSEPYIDADTGGICITFSQKVFDDKGVYHGILAMDLNLTRITDYIDSQQISNNGYGVFVSDSLHFSTHREESLMGVGMNDAGGDYPILAQKLKAGESISAFRFEDYDGTDSVAFFRTIFNGWHIGVIIPRANFYSQVYTLALVLGIMGLVLMSVLSYILIRTRNAKLRSDEENKSKSEFLSRMSHEMRTPMNAIIGMTGIAKTTDDIDIIKRCLNKVSDASSHLLGVINDVLDMSKIEAGKLELSETDFLLDKLLAQVKSVMNFKLDEKKQAYTVRIENDVPAAITADYQRLSQVLTNLLSNANKFTPENGHISLTVRLISKTDEKCRLEFSVEDDGIGITQEQQARLFRSFEQADGSISRKYGGTGLGLAISKNIVKLMDGDISVRSEPGSGSLFAFTINAGLGKSTPEYSPGNTGLLDTGKLSRIFTGKKILLAEDMEINKEILVALLSDTGVEIKWAKNGLEACEIFSSSGESFDLIFMDVHMPDVDGYEATVRIRAMPLPNSKSIPIIAMTANVFREDIEKCIDAGMDDHVGKPLDFEEVVNKMKKYML